jgi:phosphopantetheinyl transferase
VLQNGGIRLMELTRAEEVQEMTKSGMRAGFFDPIKILTCPGIPIVYTCMDENDGYRFHLLERLMDALKRADQSWESTAPPYAWILEHDASGRPLLSSEDKKGPSVSFSHIYGTTWAAMSRLNNLGIDAESPEAFKGPYPFHKVFGNDELCHALGLCCGERADASALLWSAKEAAVKSMGCGFNFFGPMEIRVKEFIRSDGSIFCRMDTNRRILVRAERHGPVWVSIGWIE